MEIKGGKGLGRLPEAATVTVFMTLQEARELVDTTMVVKAKTRGQAPLLVKLLEGLEAEVDTVDYVVETRRE